MRMPGQHLDRPSAERPVDLSCCGFELDHNGPAEEPPRG